MEIVLDTNVLGPTPEVRSRQHPASDYVLARRTFTFEMCLGVWGGGGVITTSKYMSVIFVMWLAWLKTPVYCLRGICYELIMKWCQLSLAEQIVHTETAR